MAAYLPTTWIAVARCIPAITGLMLFLSSNLSAADDNLLAHRLFQSGDYVSAAEIFTDPAWKGVAFYRSEQWWRAAEAFVRANDAASAYNLGNSYVKLGYFELALDAYLRALSMDATLVDAEHNANIMRKLLAMEDDDKQQGGRQPSSDEIERLDSEESDKQSGSGSEGEEQSDTSAPDSDEQSEEGNQSMGPQDDAKAGNGGNATEQDQASEPQDGSGGLRGDTDNENPDSRPSGGSETDTPSSASQAGGLRSALETEQATTQWLNQIDHDPQLFLQRRIELETRRRRAAGQSAPEGGTSW